MPQHSVKIPIFDGGLNTKAAIAAVPLHQSPDLQNVQFDDFGAVETIKGTSAITSIGSATIDGLFSYKKKNGTSYLVAACNGSIWRASGTTFVSLPSAQSLFTAGQYTKFIQLKDLMFQSNGGVKPYKWNGTEYTQMGVSAPTGTAVAATNATGGNLTGAYTWKYAGVNSGNVEGSLGNATNTWTGAGEEAKIGGMLTFPVSAGVNTINLYRNTAGVAGTYWRVTSLSNGITSYTDNNADSALATGNPTAVGTPPNWKYIVQYQNRLFAAGVESDPSFLYYSEANEPESWPTTNSIRIGEDDGYTITGLSVFGNSILISKSDGAGNGTVYILYMPTSLGLNDPDNWYVLKTNMNYGADAPHTMTPYSNLVGFLNREGFFASKGKELALGSASTNEGNFSADSKSYDIEPDIIALKDSLIDKSVSIAYKNKIWMAVPHGDTATENNRIYQLDFVRASSERRDIGAWSRFTDKNISSFTIHGGELYGGSSTADGTVYKLDSGTSDSGSAIDSFFKTAAIMGKKEHRNHTKVWRYAYVLIETTGAWNMDVTYINDFFDESGITGQMDCSPNPQNWGEIQYGSGKWGASRNQRRVKFYFQRSVGRALQLKFRTNTADQYFKIHEIEVYYNLRGLR